MEILLRAIYLGHWSESVRKAENFVISEGFSHKEKKKSALSIFFSKTIMMQFRGDIESILLAANFSQIGYIIIGK